MEFIWITKEKSGNKFKLNILKIGILMSSQIPAKKGIPTTRTRKLKWIHTATAPIIWISNPRIFDPYLLFVYFLEVVKDIHTLSFRIEIRAK